MTNRISLRFRISVSKGVLDEYITLMHWFSSDETLVGMGALFIVIEVVSKYLGFEQVGCLFSKILLSGER